MKYLVIFLAIVTALPLLSLASCPRQCHCSPRTLECFEGGLDELGPLLRSSPKMVDEILISASEGRKNSLELGPLFTDFKKLKVLSITHSGIPGIGSGVFLGIVWLRKVDLSWNVITHLKIEDFRGLFGLEELHLHHNLIESIPSAGFKHVPNLQVLTLNNNRLNELVTRMLFKLDRLRYLDFSGNPLGRLNPDILKDIPALQHLKCRDCLIDAFPPELSHLLPKLVSIDLGKNRIPLLDPSHLKDLKHLQELRIDGNFLKELQPYTFSGLYLSTLSLSGNEFRHVPRHTFHNCTIRHLDVSLNRLKALDGKHFRPIRDNLLSLNLSGNPLGEDTLLKVVPPLIHLRTLELGGLRLTSLPEGMLSGLDHLTRLNLSRNQLTAVPSAIDYVMSSLEVLDMSFNNLEAVTSRQSIALSLTRFKAVRLEGNPWTCDPCGHARLKNIVNVSRQREVCPREPGCVKCHSPATAAGMAVGLFATLAASDDCGLEERSSPLLFSQPTYVGIFVGCAALVLVCVIALLGALLYNARHSAKYYTHEDGGGGKGEEESFLYPASDYYINEKKPSIATIDDTGGDPQTQRVVVGIGRG